MSTADPTGLTGITATGMRMWRYVAALGWCGVLGWFAFSRETRVPLLGGVDLGFHELGHLMTYLLPVSELVRAMAGSGMEILVPLGLATYFFASRRDLLGGGVCLAWAASSMQDASVYIADAPYERLQLLGGEHDWAYSLGPDGLDRLDQAGTIARTVHDVGLVLLIVATIIVLVGLLRSLGWVGGAGAHDSPRRQERLSGELLPQDWPRV